MLLLLDRGRMVPLRDDYVADCLPRFVYWCASLDDPHIHLPDALRLPESTPARQDARQFMSRWLAAQSSPDHIMRQLSGWLI